MCGDMFPLCEGPVSIQQIQYVSFADGPTEPFHTLPESSKVLSVAILAHHALAARISPLGPGPWVRRYTRLDSFRHVRHRF